MEFNKFDETLENEVNIKLEELTNGKTPDEIYDILYGMDKEAALKIGKGNGKRLIRAIKLNMLGVEKSSIDEKVDLWHKNPSK
jgi:tRNA A37 N6-isopentenylltransferase MiaA